MGPSLVGLSVPVPDQESVQAAVASISERDPAFNLDELLAEAQQAFWLVGQAYAKCQPELCESVLSPELARRERVAIGQACENKRAVVPGSEDANTGRLLSLSSDSSGDTVTVHFVSTWQPRSGQGKQQQQQRAQNWCFHRPVSARTVQIHEGQRCTNCGGPLSSSAGTCRYCGALIGAGSGWQVIRIDDVSAERAAESAAVMGSIVAGIMAAHQARTPAVNPDVATSRPRRRSRPHRYVSLLLFLAVALGAVVVVGAAGSGKLHQDVAKVFPFVRHPELVGTLDINGQVSAANLSTMQTPPTIEFGGSCKTYADRSSWAFTAKLPDSSTFTLNFSLPPGQSEAGNYRPPEVALSANAQNTQQTSSWAQGPGTSALLTLNAGGDGTLNFGGLAPTETSQSPVSGHLSWNCSVR